MRIAVSGTHVIGKTTLVGELGERLPNHIVVPEPFELLEDRHYAFEFPPSMEDFVAQLQESLAILRDPSPNLIVDRSPLDFLAYIHASAGADRFDITAWRQQIARSLGSLDLLIVLRIDPMDDPGGLVDDAAFRLAVDGWLRIIVDDNLFDLCEDVDILVPDGPWHRRLDHVLAYLATVHTR